MQDHKRTQSGPVDLDEWDDGLSDTSSDDSSDLMFTIDHDLDEQDHDVRLMGYVAGFEPPIIHSWSLDSLSPPVSNYAARRKFSQDVIPRPILEERSATASRASVGAYSKRTSPPASSSSAASVKYYV